MEVAQWNTPNDAFGLRSEAAELIKDGSEVVRLGGDVIGSPQKFNCQQAAIGGDSTLLVEQNVSSHDGNHKRAAAAKSGHPAVIAAGKVYVHDIWATTAYQPNEHDCAP